MENQTQINDRQEAVNAWENFRKTRIWQVITGNLQVDVDDANKKINTLGQDKELKYSDRDLMIIKKKILEKVISYPQKMIDYHSGIFEEPVENHDPFSERFHEEPEEEAPNY